MEASRVSKAAVVGAGTMGNGIALALARAGIQVKVVDVNDAMLRRGMELIESGLETLAEYGSISSDEISTILHRIIPSSDLAAALVDVDFVEESVSEVPTIKKAVLEQIDSLTPPEVVIASNTSSLDVFAIANMQHPQRFAIAHFFAPAHIIPLVEVVPGSQTSAEALGATAELMKRIGKQPITMRGFVRSFIVNSIQVEIQRAAAELLGTGLVSPEEIDLAMKYTIGLRLPVIGVVQSMDFSGLDLVAKFTRSMGAGIPMVDDLVAEGALGVKTSKGFYDYGERSEAEILKERDKRLLKMIEAFEEMDVYKPI